MSNPIIPELLNYVSDMQVLRKEIYEMMKRIDILEGKSSISSKIMFECGNDTSQSKLELRDRSMKRVPYGVNIGLSHDREYLTETYYCYSCMSIHIAFDVQH